MLSRVLLVLLVVLVCRGAKGAAYSWYYDADEDVQNADFYDSYNDEIKSPQTVMESTTRLKRRDLGDRDVRTLNPEEIVDVKGVLKDILQGNKPESLRGRRTARDYTDSYDYLENSISVGPEAKLEQDLVPVKWQPTGEVQQETPTVKDQEYLDDRSSQDTEQHWSFMYEPETSTYGKDDIVAEVMKMIPVRNGQVPRRSSIDLWRPTQKVQTWGTTEETEETEDTLIYPQETTMYSNSDMLASVRKLVQHWSSSSSVNVQEPTTTYSNSDMQAEVRKLVQHWSSISSDNMQEPTIKYRNSDMQAEVRKLVQHWSSIAQDDSSSVNMNQQNTGKQTEVRNLEHWNPILDYNPSFHVQSQNPSMNVQHWSFSDNAQTRIPSDNVPHRVASDNVKPQNLSLNVQHWNPSLNVQHWNPSLNVQHWNPSLNVQHWNPSLNVQHQNPSINVQHWSPSQPVQQGSSSENVQHWSPTIHVQQWDPVAADNQANLMKQQNTGKQTEVRNLEHWNPILDYNPSFHVKSHNPSMNVQHWSFSDNVQTRIPSDNVPHRVASDNVKPQNLSLNVQHWNPSLNVQHQNPSINVQHWSPSQPVQQGSSSENVQHWSPSIHVQQWDPVAADNQENLPNNAAMTDLPIREKNETETDTVGDTQQMWNKSYNIEEPKLPQGYERQRKKGVTRTRRKYTTSTTTTEPTTTSTMPTTTTRRMDIDAIMAIISNLTYDYEWNLTDQFNKTIIEHGVPTCPWEKWGPGGVWTRVINGTTEFPWDFENTSVVSKCFVCGLKTPEIPRNAYCADAFAGDFLPLMPIDAQSRGKIAGFRKYCRYIDAQNYLENPDEPRAIYGRFTGGCAVRWTDITGVYTQRTCRSKFRPLMGKHFASKRMAKLELALVNVENGCIISPMATLLPVSRGISLYARFHACVCNTNWCNQATIEQASLNTLATIVLAYWLVHYP